MNLAIKDITTALDIIENIDLVEEEMLKLPQAPCPVRHHFGPGVYIREIFMAAGTFAVGHEWKKDHMNIFLKGKVHMIKDDGTTQIIEAPMIFTGKPGRKIGMILEDLVWLNVIPTEETDIDTIEDQIIDKSPGFNLNKSSLRLLKDASAQEDYLAALADLDVSEDDFRAECEREDDLIPFPEVTDSVKVSDSQIEGKGLFATAEFTPGQVIAPTRLAGLRTPAARFINHSANPNAVLCASGQVLYLMAINYISGCRGGQDGDEITIDYRQSAETIRSQPCQS